jgi:proteasome lid subunit RPN8/RPN11
MIRLSDLHLQIIRQHGAETFPQECVGVLLGSVDSDTKKVAEVRPLPNTFEPNEEFERSVFNDFNDFNHDEPQAVLQPMQTVGQERRYLLSPDTMFALMQEERRTKRKVLGFYHSHPDHPARPSVYDREWASPWYTYIIVSILQGKPDALTAWQLSDDRAVFNPEEIIVQTV